MADAARADRGSRFGDGGTGPPESPIVVGGGRCGALREGRVAPAAAGCRRIRPL